jgi:hypothetical protein
MISYHIVASVSAEQRVDLARQAERQRLISEGRVVRKRVRRQVRVQRRRQGERARVGQAPLALLSPAVTSARLVHRRSRPAERLIRLWRWATQAPKAAFLRPARFLRREQS